MKVWVTRDKGIGNRFCYVWLRKPCSRYAIYTQGGSLFNIMPDRFKKVFRFTPRKGSCKQMELSLTEIE